MMRVSLSVLRMHVSSPCLTLKIFTVKVTFLVLFSNELIHVHVINLYISIYLLIYLSIYLGNWQSVSEDAKDLVRQMLELDPAARITTAQVNTFYSKLDR